MMAFRKRASLALALTAVVLCLGCTDELNAPATTNEQPVSPPTNVSASALNDGDVRLTWSPSSDPMVAGYNLYRREVGQNTATKLNQTRLLDTQYRDETTVAGKSYEYRVTAVNTRGSESLWTSVTIQAEVDIVGGNGKLPARGTD